MSEHKKPKCEPSLLVEDEQTAGGVDEQGNDVIKPKNGKGKVTEGTTPTDKREALED